MYFMLCTDEFLSKAVETDMLEAIQELTSNQKISDINEFIDLSNYNLLAIQDIERIAKPYERLNYGKFNSTIEIWDKIHEITQEFNYSTFVICSIPLMISTLLSEDPRMSRYIDLFDCTDKPATCFYYSWFYDEYDLSSCKLLKVSEYKNIVDGFMSKLNGILTHDSVLNTILKIFAYDESLIDLFATSRSYENRYVVTFDKIPTEFLQKSLKRMLKIMTPSLLMRELSEWPKDLLEPYVEDILKCVYKVSMTYYSMRLIERYKDRVNMDKLKSIKPAIHANKYYTLFKNNKMTKGDKIISEIIQCSLKNRLKDYERLDSTVTATLAFLGGASISTARKTDLYPIACLIADYMTNPKKNGLFLLYKYKINNWSTDTNKEMIIKLCDEIIRAMGIYGKSKNIEQLFEELFNRKSFHAISTTFLQIEDSLLDTLMERIPVNTNGKIKAAYMYAAI